MCWLLDIFFLQLIVIAVFAAVYSCLTIYFYKEILDSKEEQKTAVRKMSFFYG